MAEWELTDEEIAKAWVPLNQIVKPQDMVFIEGKAIAQAQARKLLEYIQGKFEPSNNRCAYTILEREWFELRRQVGL